MTIRNSLLAIAVAGMTTVTHAKTVECRAASEKEIAGRFDGWNAALATLKPDRVVERYATLCNSAIDAGIYTFTFGDGRKVQARFTFTYDWNGSKWLISSHHSSVLPEANAT